MQSAVCLTVLGKEKRTKGGDFLLPLASSTDFEEAEQAWKSFCFSLTLRCHHRVIPENLLAKLQQRKKIATASELLYGEHDQFVVLIFVDFPRRLATSAAN